MNKKDVNFIATVLTHYRAKGRHTLPWRATRNPYRILVSEIMLQQTQVERVIPKYHAFLKQFPTASVLANAKLGEVLIAWQGLGYNRRAKLLHACAKIIVEKYQGKFPQSYDELRALPGVGPYTAGAILAFAFHIAAPIIETNIRTVIMYHYFKNKDSVTDKEIHIIVQRTLPQSGVHVWYAALMDYGAFLKQASGNHNTRSRHYVAPSRFVGSDRQLRGLIIKVVAKEQKVTAKQLIARVKERFTPTQVRSQLRALKTEGMLVQKNQEFSLP